MIGLDHVYLSQRGAGIVPIDRLADSHGVSGNSARIYDRFFGQTGVRLSSCTHHEMMLDALEGLLANYPELRETLGCGIYTKTQTHNTFFEQDWLTEVFANAGLAHWETLTFSMTHCASGIAAAHLGVLLNKPFILLTGEKAFHPAGNRLSAGLLGEAAVSILFKPNGKYRLRSTHVAHLPRYHINPDDMSEPDRTALRTEFEGGLTNFLQTIVDEDPDFFRSQPIVVPYNLNPPLISRSLRAVGLDKNISTGIDTTIGHMFCSDNYLSVANSVPPEGSPAFLFSAGHGVTYAAMKLEPAQLN